MTQPVLRQASCISIGGRGVLIEGPAGSGKTSLALMLIDRGARLVGDDGVLLALRDGRLWGLPPPNIAGKLEIRGVGIVELPCVETQLSLHLILSPGAPPRYVERAGQVDLGLGQLPSLMFDAQGPAAAIRAEYALNLHGLALPAQSETHSRAT